MRPEILRDGGTAQAKEWRLKTRTGFVGSVTATVEQIALEPAADGTWIGWTAPSDPGAETVGYELLRAPAPSDLSGAVCLPIDDPAARDTLDSDLPAPGGLFVYLVRAVNSCPDGAGPLGDGGTGSTREAAGCP